MKISFPLREAVIVTACLGGLPAGVESLQAEPVQYPAQTQYASAYYPPRAPTPMDRIRNAGQNVGDFIRRKFYGVNAPTSYPQAPVYQSPGGRRSSSYSLDAPAQPPPVERSSGTGYQRPEPETTPKYVRPPTPPASETKEDKSAEVAAPKKATKPATKSTSKSSSSRTAAKTASKTPVASTGGTVSKKRYSPAKPSNLTKSTTTSSKKRVEDEAPQVTKSSQDEPPAPPEPPKLEESSPKASGTETAMNKGFYPLPGPEPVTTTTGPASISSGKDESIAETPARTDSPATIKESPSASGEGSTGEIGVKSSGSFLVGKKTSKAGRVVSPHPPYNELDITGLPGGSLALDPTTQKVFEVP